MTVLPRSNTAQWVELALVGVSSLGTAALQIQHSYAEYDCEQTTLTL